MRTLPASLNGHKHLVLPTPIVSPPVPQPEALCSVNGFFEVAGYGRMQATGRGESGEEAAEHLADTIRQTKLKLEAPQPVSDEEKVALLLACGIKRAVAKQDFCLVERLAKAAALVTAKKVEPGEREGMLAVRSLKDSLTYYEVDDTACSCPDYKHRHQDDDKVYYCKHGLAAMMYRKIHN